MRNVISLDLNTVRWDKKGPSNPPPVPLGAKDSKRLVGTVVLQGGGFTIISDDITKAIYNQVYFMDAPTTQAMDFSWYIERFRFWAPPGGNGAQFTVTNYYDGTSSQDSGTNTSRPYAGGVIPSASQHTFDSSDNAGVDLFHLAGTATWVVTYIITVGIRAGNGVPIQGSSFTTKKRRIAESDKVGAKRIKLLGDGISALGDHYSTLNMVDDDAVSIVPDGEPAKQPKRRLFGRSSVSRDQR